MKAVHKLSEKEYESLRALSVKEIKEAVMTSEGAETKNIHRVELGYRELTVIYTEVEATEADDPSKNEKVTFHGRVYDFHSEVTNLSNTELKDLRKDLNEEGYWTKLEKGEGSESYLYTHKKGGE